MIREMAVIILALRGGAVAGEGPGNLIRNGGFETDADKDGTADGW